MSAEEKKEEPTTQEQPQQAQETRRCDICGQVLSRMWLTNNKEVQWLFQGENAHLECYIDLIVNRAVKENLDKMCNDNQGRFKEAVEGLSAKVAKQLYDETAEKNRGFFSRIFN